MSRKLLKKRSLLVVGLVLTTVCFLAAEIFQDKLSDLADESQPFQSGKRNQLEDKIANYTKKFAINWYCKLPQGMTAWQLAESWITSRHITDPSESNKLGCVLAAMRNERITHADTSAKGTQLKVTLTVESGQMLVMKPKAYSGDYVMVGTAYAGKDRHNAEIAAFHLNRIIGLNRAPIIVGRKVDLESELRPVAHKNLLNTYYYQDGNSCFYGKCHYCKGPETGVCAERTNMEGSLSLWFPNSYILSKPLPHPWRRTYRPNKPAVWEKDGSYCTTVKNTRPYETPPRLLDLIDLSIFDFIISNADRHHYETFEYSKDSIVVALDNGKSFGNPYTDEITILMPLLQCCTIRRSTYDKLSDLSEGVLGQVFFQVLQTEPLAPLLTPQHFLAVDRRLQIIIRTVSDCITKKKGIEADVLVDDGYV
ncbi:glycosaminoglycan xylosylkinase-like [Watersipora subatra]|uniref:glycosaminoglycan xylosylkinase-like n=1 Tax=Watersipora subatra TaxID=2589382 RepID=UPI00355BB504